MEEFVNSSNIRIAEKPERLINFMVDRFIILLFSILFSSFFIFSDSFLKDTSLLSLIIFIFIHVFYYFIFELTSGQTIGKKITGTKVVKRGNGKISFFNIFIRTITRLFFLDVYSYLFGNEVGMHDTLSDTLVVKFI